MGNLISKKYYKLEKKCIYCKRYLPNELITNENHMDICKLCNNTKKKLIKNYVAYHRKYPSAGELIIIEGNLMDLLKDFSKEDLDKIDYNKIL